MMVLTNVIQQTTAPIANVAFCLNFLSILWLISQLHIWMLMNPSHQSVFRRNDCTETLLLRHLSDFYSTLVHGQGTLLALLDGSSAFDSFDHPVLIVLSHLSWLGVPASRMT